MTEIKDVDGNVIEVGATVAQLWVKDPAGGALDCNGGRKGKVLSIGRTRVEVQFNGRTKFNNFTKTDEPVPDKVAAKYLAVVKDGVEPNRAFRTPADRKPKPAATEPVQNAWRSVVVAENPALARDTVERRWARVFDLAEMPSMLHENAKHKTFDPVRVIVEFSQYNEEPPRINKIVFHGPFTANGEAGGQRIFRTLDFEPDVAEDLRELLRDKIATLVEQIAGVPPRDSLFARMARRANGATTEPFTIQEEELWQMFRTIEAGLPRR